MKRSFVTIGFVIWVIVLTAACDPARPVKVERAAPEPTPNIRPVDDHDHDADSDAPRISLADAKKDFDSKAAVFVDTHGKEQFDAEHIAGAINVPANLLDQNLSKIPKGKKIILYCS